MQKISTRITVVLLLLSSFGITSFTTPLMEEICDNGIDDNGNGLIDLNDPQCECEIVNTESLFPNPSFEEKYCCPNTDGQLECVVGWSQASGATTDYLNTCDYNVAEHMVPFPDGEGALLIITGSTNVGNGNEVYKEYAGACLNRPMQKDSTYKFKFHLGFLDANNSPEINFAFFGSPSCSNLPFTSASDCPTNYPDWYLLKTEYVDSGGEFPKWVEATTTIKPQMDINSLVIGGDCLVDNEAKLRLYMIDNLRLNEESVFDFEVVENVSRCDPDFVFEVVDNGNFSYQWYKEGIALVGENSAALSQMYGDGAYQLRKVDGSGQCRITEEFIFELPIFETDFFEVICEDESIMFQGDIIDDIGVYEYLLTSVEGCDSIVTLTVEEEEGVRDSIFVRVLAGAVYEIGGLNFTNEGEYEVNLTTQNGCDSIVLLNLETIDVHVPNIFSPNGDGVNDYFEVMVDSDEVVLKEMSIYDRLGGLVYSGQRWDGTFNNSFVNPGVYVYFVRLEDVTGHDLIISNSVTVLR